MHDLVKIRITIYKPIIILYTNIMILIIYNLDK